MGFKVRTPERGERERASSVVELFSLEKPTTTDIQEISGSHAISTQETSTHATVMQRLILITMGGLRGFADSRGGPEGVCVGGEGGGGCVSSQ